MVQPDASEVILHVGKTGLFSFAGHSHEIDAPIAEGAITATPGDWSQSSLSMAFDAAALRVTGRGEPAGDVPDVQRTMESDRVLDVARFPQITFASTAVQVLRQESGTIRLRVTGTLTLHGRSQPETADVSLELGADRLTAAGTLRVKQTDFGIEPVTAGAGTVRVRDEVEIEFRIVARAAGTGAAAVISR